MTFIVPTDPGYLSAKQIKRGDARIDPVFDGFVDGFRSRFGTSPLAIGTDSIERPRHGGRRPRLAVVLERTSQYNAFLRGPFEQDSTAQQQVARLLTATVPARVLRRRFGLPWALSPPPPPADDILVRFQDFEAVALSEVHDLVASNALQRFEAGLGIGEQFWCTKRLSGPPIVFVHTDEQARALRGSPKINAWADSYYEIVKPFDEFGYLDRADISIAVDSKQNVETNYAGNWYYYFK